MKEEVDLVFSDETSRVFHTTFNKDMKWGEMRFPSPPPPLLLQPISSMLRHLRYCSEADLTP